MYCPVCRAEYTEEDTYCRHCGGDLAVTSTSIVPTQTRLPAVFYHPQLPRKIAAGVGALALGAGLELLRRSLLTRLTQPTPRSLEHALPTLTGLKDILLPQHDKPVKRPKKGYEVQETVVYIRRVTTRH